MYRMVWIPKYRRRILVEQVAERLKQTIEQTAAEREWAVAPSYFIASAGNVSAETIERYIREQTEGG